MGRTTERYPLNTTEKGKRMGDQTEGSIVIQAPPPRVIEVIADFEAYPEWAGEFKKAEIRERDSGGRAVRVYFEVSAGPVNAKYTLAYDYLPGDAGVTWSFVEGSPIKDLHGEYLLEPDDGATRVTYRMAIDLGIPVLGFIKRQGEKRIIDTALKGLKKRVESRS